MKNATLRQLKIFESVARLLSFSRAAEELHLTQPAVSTQMRTLEGHAGLPLFEQLGKKVFLTAAGTELLHHSRMIIRQFEEAEAAMAQFKGVTGGRLNIAVISAGDYFLPGLLVDFARRHEGVKINFEVLNRTELLAQLGDNLTDLAIMVRPPEDADTLCAADRAAPLRGRRVARPSAGARACDPAGAAGARAVHRAREGIGYARLDGRGLRPPHPQAQHRLEMRSTETIKQAVLAGMGVAFLSIHTVARELRERSSSRSMPAASRSCCAGTWCNAATSACRRWRRPFKTSWCATARR